MQTYNHPSAVIETDARVDTDTVVEDAAPSEPRTADDATSVGSRAKLVRSLTPTLLQCVSLLGLLVRGNIGLATSFIFLLALCWFSLPEGQEATVKPAPVEEKVRQATASDS